MRVIIAGSRELYGTEIIQCAVNDSGFTITELVEGECYGIDVSARNWAIKNNIPYKPFPADWNNIHLPDSIVKTRKDGTLYDAYAGIRRNKEMAMYAEALIAIPSADSKGTNQMIEIMKKLKRPIFVYVPKSESDLF